MRLFCTDLDRTLLANGHCDVSPAAMPVLRRLIERIPLTIAYVTGRDIDLVLQAIEEHELPRPDAVIADIGTTVYHATADGLMEDLDWRAGIGPDWRGRCGEAVLALLDADRRLVRQAPDRQRRFKCSYVVAASENVEVLECEVRALLDAEGLASAIVVSREPGSDYHLLDVIPAHATKRHAIEFLADRLGIARQDVLFSGDSGNDLDALAADFPSVLVANADESVRRMARDLASAAEAEHLLYLARGDFPLPNGERLNGNYSGGIVEGIMHFFPAFSALLEPELPEPRA